MALHDVLSRKSAEIIQRWKTDIRGSLTPESMPSSELVDHIPQFLREIKVALRENAGLPTEGPTPEQSSTAAGHGEQRLRLGFSLDAVVREYGSLRTSIFAVAADTGEAITFQETQIVFDCIVEGIANAVTEYALQRDAESLRNANEHFAFIAHELRNPLSAALLAYHQIRNAKFDPSEERTFASLGRGLRRTSQLIDQTLNVARVASGVELHRTMTSLKELLDDVEGVSNSTAVAKDIRVNTTVANHAPVSLDVRLVRSAVSNLVLNAVKYSHDGGTVEVRANVVNDRVVIEVEDSCGGLPPGKVEAAFTPFVRVDTTQTGFGLGLAIAKQAADAHGGSIRVQNMPGKGCMFVLEFPIV